MIFNSVEMMRIQKLQENHSDHEFYFKNKRHMVSFASESYIMVTMIDLHNISLTINHMNQTIQEAKSILENELGQEWRWTVETLHIEVVENEFNHMVKYHTNFLKTLENSTKTQNGKHEIKKRFILEAIAGLVGIATTINSGRNTYEISQGFLYTWTSSLGTFYATFVIIKISKKDSNIICRSSKNITFPKIWRVCVKN